MANRDAFCSDSPKKYKGSITAINYRIIKVVEGVPELISHIIKYQV